MAHLWWLFPVENGNFPILCEFSRRGPGSTMVSRGFHHLSDMVAAFRMPRMAKTMLTCWRPEDGPVRWSNTAISQIFMTQKGLNMNLIPSCEWRWDALSYLNPDFEFNIEKDYLSVFTKVKMVQELFDFFDLDQDGYWNFTESWQCCLVDAVDPTLLRHEICCWGLVQPMERWF